MKKLIVTGMVLLSTSFASAAGVAKGGSRMNFADYVKKGRDSMYGQVESAAGLDAVKLSQVKKVLVEKLAMPELNRSLSGESGTKHVDQLIAIVAAKLWANDTKNGASPEDSPSLARAANATAKLIANSHLIGGKPKIESLSKDEVALVRESIKKLESLPADILIKFSNAERDSYSAVIEKYDELNASGSQNSAEENFVQAIMDVKGVSKEKALEIVEKLRKC